MAGRTTHGAISTPERTGGLRPENRRRPGAGLGAKVAGVLGLAVLALVAGCSVTLPDRTSLPSISLPPRPTALPSIGRPTATATETATATATTTATATVTVSASSEPPAETAPEATPEPESPLPEDGGSGLWWLLVLALVAGLGVAGGMWLRSRSAAKEIERRFGLVRNELAWADDDLLPRVLNSPSAAEAAAIWEAGRPRMLVVEEELRQLSVSSSGKDQGDRAQGLRTALASLVTAVDAETSLDPSADSGRLRSARARVEETRQTVRTLLIDPDEER